MTLPEKLRKLRTEKGFTQLEVANLISVEQSVYSKIESGKINPDVSKLLKLSQVYGIDINELLGNNVFNNINYGENQTNNNYNYINNLKIQEQENTILKKENSLLKEEILFLKDLLKKSNLQ